MDISRKIRKSDIKNFLLHSLHNYNTVALCWNRISDDSEEYYEFKISFGKMNDVVIEFLDLSGPETSDCDINVCKVGDIASLNELYGWLKARPDYDEVHFHFEEWW